MRMGWSDTGFVPARVGTHVADKITIGLSLYLLVLAPKRDAQPPVHFTGFVFVRIEQTSAVVRIRVAWFHQGLRRGAP